MQCPNGKKVKPLTHALLNRRAKSHFKDTPLPLEYLMTIFGIWRSGTLRVKPAEVEDSSWFATNKIGAVWVAVE